MALGEVLQRCRALDAEGLAWIERPLRYDDLDGHARLARDIGTPVMPGENFSGPRAMHDAIRARACGLVMPDLVRIGGVTAGSRRQRAERLGRELHLPDVPGNGLESDEDAVARCQIDL